MDELLQAEQIDERELYMEYEKKSYDLFREFRYAEALEVWKEAYHRMPGNIEVKEMLMSVYFDTDKVKYKDEVIDLGTEIYNSDVPTYYKSQVIWQLARTYAETGNNRLARQWASRAARLYHSEEFLYMEISDDPEEVQSYFYFANHWYLEKLFYASCNLCKHADKLPGGLRYTHSVDKVIAQMYELVMPGDDMVFEDLHRLTMQHRGIAEDETALDRDETVIRHHLTRAMECAVKSMTVEEHELSHPLVKGWNVLAAPADNKMIVRMYRDELNWDCFTPWREKDWFRAITDTLDSFL